MPDNRAITEWATSPSAARRTAAALARELAGAPPHQRIESSVKIAARFHVSTSVAESARYHLIGQQIIYKSGPHYYVTARPRT